MYYELYIDVFFFVNFMMDGILLLLVRRMLFSSVSYGRIWIGGAVGAALTCLVMMLPIHNAFIKFILFHGVVNIAMIQTGLGIKWGRELFKSWMMLYIGGMLLGGVLQMMRPYIRTGSLFFALAVASYYIVKGIWAFLSYLTRYGEQHLKVVIRMGDNCCEVDALVDTGNTLRDSLSGQPVSIVNAQTATRLVEGNKLAGIRYIPYHTIGKREGVMPLIRVDAIEIRAKERKIITSPLLAVSKEKISEDHYQMILNPDVLTGGIDYGYKSCGAKSV